MRWCMERKHFAHSTCSLDVSCLRVCGVGENWVGLLRFGGPVGCWNDLLLSLDPAYTGVLTL